MQKIKVLIVEDDKSICDMYAVAFMRAGFTVYMASDGEQALEKYRYRRPDILLLDIMMPRVDGYTVLKAVRDDLKEKYVPVIMLTNLDPSQFEKNADFDGIDDYLIKSNHTPAEVVEKTKAILRVNKIL